jgi:hypothetical protein
MLRSWSVPACSATMAVDVTHGRRKWPSSCSVLVSPDHDLLADSAAPALHRLPQGGRLGALPEPRRLDGAGLCRRFRKENDLVVIGDSIEVRLADQWHQRNQRVALRADLPDLTFVEK